MSPAVRQLSSCQGDSRPREAQVPLEPQALEAPCTCAKTFTLQAAIRKDVSPGPLAGGAGQPLHDSVSTLAERSSRLTEGRLPGRRPQTHATGRAPSSRPAPDFSTRQVSGVPKGRSPRSRAHAVCSDVKVPSFLWGRWPCCHRMAACVCGIRVPAPPVLGCTPRVVQNQRRRRGQHRNTLPSNLGVQVTC